MLLSAYEENEGPLAVLNRFTEGVNLVILCWKENPAVSKVNSAKIGCKEQCLWLGNGILDRVVQRRNAYCRIVKQ